MADEVVAPVALTQDPAPVAPVETVVAPVTESIVVTPTPEITTPEPVAEAPKPTETVLGEALKDTIPQESAPVQPTEATEAPTDGGQSVEPAPPPKYDTWTLPEGVTLEETSVGEFTNLLSELELEGKADHATVQKFGQKAVDFYLNEQKKTVEGITKIYQDAWEKQKTDWREATISDPELGGNRLQTTLDSALSFIRTHGGTPEQQAEFRQLMDSSGLGNHPTVVRLFANAGRAMSEGRPLAAPKPVSQPKSRTATMYGKS